MEYMVKLLKAVITRLKTITMNPVRNFFRKFQTILNINVIANKLLNPVVGKFRELFHIKPRSREEYFSMGRLLIARKLVTALIVACCIGLFVWFNFVAEPIDWQVTTSTRVDSDIYFDYDDMKLMEYTGKANIRAANGRVVYTGDIKNGVCDGKGVLHNQSGVLIYEGDFVENMYSGQGRGYSSEGVLQYEGGYENNVYEGEGTLYYASGQVQYKGLFSNGLYHGTGWLYGEDGSLIYEGNFLNGLYHGTGILYYEDGDKNFQGDFVMGNPHGTGTLYDTTGRPYYTGIVAHGAIAYESLLSLSVADIEEMFLEEPQVYYTLNDTCYVYEKAQVILELDCIVRIVIRDREQNQDELAEAGQTRGWYLPEEEDSGQPVTEPSSRVLGEDTDADTSGEDEALNAESDLLVQSLGELIQKMNEAGQEPEDEDMPTDLVTEEEKVYYFIGDKEWVNIADLDKGSIFVEGVTVYAENLENSLWTHENYIAVNGMTELADCVAIEKIKERNPMLFGNIFFERVGQSKDYVYIKNINFAQAIYAELADKENVSYQFCYQIDDAESLYYCKMKAAP